MKKLLHISTQVDGIDLLKNLVEKLAIKRNQYPYRKDILPRPWQAIETSSLESYISGSINISISENESLHVPYTSNFLFSCKRETDHAYKFNWGMSMS